MPSIGPPPPLIPNASAQQQLTTAVITAPLAGFEPVPIIATSELNSSATFSQPLGTNYAQLTLDGSVIETQVQHVQLQVQAKPNIDLGEVVRSTIINGVTKTFTQVNKKF